MIFKMIFPVLLVCFSLNAAEIKNKFKVSATSLNRYAKVVYSQFGEDGIIEEIFSRLNIDSGNFIEFGAANGIWLSNTRHLWEKGWKGVMIEVKLRDFRLLKENYKNTDRVICLNYFVSPNPKSPKECSLDQIIEQHFPDEEVDFVSIDIDGLDLKIFEALRARPKVICIETNLYWHPNLKVRIPDNIAAQNLNQPLSIVIEAARKKGYIPVCQTINLFLIREDLYTPFSDTPSDPKILWLDGFYSSGRMHSINQFRLHNKYIRAYESKYLNDVERELY